MVQDAAFSPDEVSQLPVIWRGDVLVAGGGSAGSSAAVAAARLGARVLLVESGAFLGGTGARVLDTFYGFFAPGDDSQRVVGGIGWEVCESLFAADAAFSRPNTYGAGTGITYEPDDLKVVWDELVTGSGASVLFYALVTATIQDATGVVGLVAETKAGRGQLQAEVVIDATGDAEVAWRAGAAMDRSIDAGQRQPATATFRVGGVSEDALNSTKLQRLMRDAGDAGYRLPRVDGSSHVTNLPGVRHTNLTRIAGFDATDPWQLTAAELEGRRQVREYLRFLKTEVQGYEDSYLVSVSSRLGIRETRRLDGEYVLTRDDVMSGLDFGDAIARCGAPLEDHAADLATRWEYIGSGEDPTGETYGIPYRCLIPQVVDRLLVAGRCLSASHDAHASVRSMAQCMAMGQAAGSAAALAVNGRVQPRDVDVDELRKCLVDQGAYL